MNNKIAATYDALSKQAANDLWSLIGSIKHPLVCLASGDSPSGLYKELVERTKHEEIDPSDWFFIGLDEWGGMNGSDEGSCRYHLDHQFFGPLEIKKERICFFDGKSIDPEAECRRIENFIQQHGGIDVAILGLGMNGHVGMNEPGTSASLRSHLAHLDPLTQQVGQKYFSQPVKLSHGLTLGMVTLKEAKHIMLIVNGEHKASIVKKVLEGEISEQIPGSLLRDHPGSIIYLDKAAAQLI